MKNCLRNIFSNEASSNGPKKMCAVDPQTGAIYVDSVCQLWYETSTKWVELGMSGKGIYRDLATMYTKDNWFVIILSHVYFGN